jgi:hypothetical protein
MLFYQVKVTFYKGIATAYAPKAIEADQEPLTSFDPDRHDPDRPFTDYYYSADLFAALNFQNAMNHGKTLLCEAIL